MHATQQITDRETAGMRPIAKDKMSPQTCITKSEGHLPVPTHQRLIAIIMYVETGLQSAEMQGTDKLAAALTKQTNTGCLPDRAPAGQMIGNAETGQSLMIEEEEGTVVTTATTATNREETLGEVRCAPQFTLHWTCYIFKAWEENVCIFSRCCDAFF